MKRIYISLQFFKTMSGALLAFALVVLISNTNAESQELQRSIAMGTVHWNRDLDSALKLSSQTGKPLFVLFQEIPG